MHTYRPDWLTVMLLKLKSSWTLSRQCLYKGPSVPWRTENNYLITGEKCRNFGSLALSSVPYIFWWGCNRFHEMVLIICFCFCCCVVLWFCRTGTGWTACAMRNTNSFARRWAPQRLLERKRCRREAANLCVRSMPCTVRSVLWEPRRH